MSKIGEIKFGKTIGSLNQASEQSEQGTLSNLGNTLWQADESSKAVYKTRTKYQARYLTKVAWQSGTL